MEILKFKGFKEHYLNLYFGCYWMLLDAFEYALHLLTTLHYGSII